MKEFLAAIVMIFIIVVIVCFMIIAGNVVALFYDLTETFRERLIAKIRRDLFKEDDS